MASLKNTSARTRGVVGVLAVSALSIGAVQAIAAPAGGGNQAVTSNPDLVSASVVRGYSATPGDPAPRVQACYDAALSTASAPGSFRLRGYDSSVVSPASTAVTVNPANPNCLLIDFAPSGGPPTVPVDVADYTVLEAQPAAGKTVGASGLDTAGGTAALEGTRIASRLGATSLPDLLTTTVSDADRTVTFTFDAPLDASDVPTGTEISAYDQSGNLLPAGTAVVRGASVVVTYASVTGTNRPVRFAIDGNSVTSVNGDQNVLQASGASTDVPELQSATPTGTTQFTLTYDGPVTPSFAALGVVTEDGTYRPATSAIAGGNSSQVVITVPTVENYSEKVVGLIDLGGVAAAAPATGSSTPAYVGLRSPNSVAGYTDGPDLRSVVLNTTTNQATWTFDQPLAATPAAASLTLRDADGALLGGSGASSTGSTVTVQYSAAQITRARSAAIAAGVVNDRQSKPNPPSVIGLGAAGTTPPPTTTTPPTTTPPTTTSPGTTTPPVTTPPVVRPPVVVPPTTTTTPSTPATPLTAKGRLSATTPARVRRGRTVSVRVVVRNASKSGVGTSLKLRVTTPTGLRLVGSRFKNVGTLRAGQRKTITVKFRTSRSTKSSTTVRFRLAGKNTLSGTGSVRIRVR